MPDFWQWSNDPKKRPHTRIQGEPQCEPGESMAGECAQKALTFLPPPRKKLQGQLKE